MEITVNGEKRSFTAEMSIGGLLTVLGVNPKAVVVERNLKIVDRAALDTEPVQHGDSIEIIRLVGGG